jgi:arylsulfatase A-like enzyme
MILLLFCGCSDLGTSSPVGPTARQTPETNGNTDSPPAAAEEPSVRSDQPDLHEEDAQGMEARNPLISGLERMLGDSPVFRDTEEWESQLREADLNLDQAKRENREALREMNRPLIVGPPPPNIVLIVADDLGFGDLGCYGQKYIQTPHVDRLASEGMRLDQFYAGGVTSDSSWWCLMTGCYTKRYGQDREVYPDETRSRFTLDSRRITLGEMMWQSGYDTGFVGNWYLTGPVEPQLPHLHGFDDWCATLFDDGSLTHYPESVQHFERRLGDIWKHPVRNNSDGRQEAYIDDYMAKEAITFLRQHRRDRPFLLVVGFRLPHRPLTVPEDELYSDRGWDESRRAYAAMVTRLDAYVGEILDALADSALEKNTVVLFTSDNAAGPGDVSISQFFASRGDLRDQASELYEGAIRVPLIVRWPQHVPAASTSSSPAALWDLLPTCAELARVPAHRRPVGVDGISLFPLLKGKELVQRPRMYWKSFTNGSAEAVRLEPDGAWKAVLPAGKEHFADIELYDLSNDERETNDLSEEHPDTVMRAVEKSERRRSG